MRAVVYHGPGRKAWEEVPDPEIIGDGDAIVRVDAVTICGTDLHILKGDAPAVHQGRILGHEAVGTIEEVGEGVHTLAPGQRVLVSCISACGTCRSAVTDVTGSAWAPAAGFLATRSTAPRPSTSACRSRTRAPMWFPTGSATRRSSCWPTSCRPVTRSGCSTGRSTR